MGGEPASVSSIAIVDDAGRTYKAVHYDHRNGIAIADVDGDGYQDIYFSNQVGGNQLWRNRGDGTFEEYKPTRPEFRRPTESASPPPFADIDNDGDPDLYVTAVSGRETCFLKTTVGEALKIFRKFPASAYKGTFLRGGVFRLSTSMDYWTFS